MRKKIKQRTSNNKKQAQPNDCACFFPDNFSELQVQRQHKIGWSGRRQVILLIELIS